MMVMPAPRSSHVGERRRGDADRNSFVPTTIAVDQARDMPIPGTMVRAEITTAGATEFKAVCTVEPLSRLTAEPIVLLDISIDRRFVSSRARRSRQTSHASEVLYHARIQDRVPQAFRAESPP
jgi:hypothetical protein